MKTYNRADLYNDIEEIAGNRIFNNWNWQGLKKYFELHEEMPKYIGTMAAQENHRYLLVAAFVDGFAHGLVASAVLYGLTRNKYVFLVAGANSLRQGIRSAKIYKKQSGSGNHN
jgi:hypothetical protein